MTEFKAWERSAITATRPDAQLDARWIEATAVLDLLTGNPNVIQSVEMEFERLRKFVITEWARLAARGVLRFSSTINALRPWMPYQSATQYAATDTNYWKKSAILEVKPAAIP